MIPEIIHILRQLPTGSQQTVRDFAQAELNRLKLKAQKRQQARAKRNCDQDQPMYRNLHQEKKTDD